MARLLDNPDEADQSFSLVRNRGVAQRLFRAALMKCYSGRCCMCSTSFVEVLEAAHIIPWNECSASEKLDVRNGLLLCANHHALFDSAYITVSDKYCIMYADPDALYSEYSKADKSMSLKLHGRPIALPSERKHRPSRAALRSRALE